MAAAARLLLLLLPMLMLLWEMMMVHSQCENQPLSHLRCVPHCPRYPGRLGQIVAGDSDHQLLGSAVEAARALHEHVIAVLDYLSCHQAAQDGRKDRQEKGSVAATGHDLKIPSALSCPLI